VLAEVESWAAEFERLGERIGPRFARPEVRRYQAWYRHVTLSMLALAFLAVVRARAAAVGTGGG